ncbi:helix-turn-helix transcriptional regulator [Bacillus haynesii]|uniref:helix-turn-helix domain-containing protein n=1 Tax=Bacillus haynesii TaxID=1925021 RepID=UPI002282B655|nr:helix-turn-helix transcriptional regulator [Bacillus haynesii]MCY8609863.1 helix-turn-helix transcriptional regulator [Bacillus haynesii]
MKLRVREILEERGMEQKELAKATGLSARAISDLCSNKGTRYYKETLERIIRALELKDANDLFDLESNEDT